MSFKFQKVDGYSENNLQAIHQTERCFRRLSNIRACGCGFLVSVIGFRQFVMKSVIAFVRCPESRSASRRLLSMVIVSAVGRLSASRRVRYRRFDCILICIPSVLMKLTKAYTGKPPPPASITVFMLRNSLPVAEFKYA